MVAEIPHHAHLDKHLAAKHEMKSFAAGLILWFFKVMKHMQVVSLEWPGISVGMPLPGAASYGNSTTPRVLFRPASRLTSGGATRVHESSRPLCVYR